MKLVGQINIGKTSADYVTNCHLPYAIAQQILASEEILNRVIKHEKHFIIIVLKDVASDK